MNKKINLNISLTDLKNSFSKIYFFGRSAAKDWPRLFVIWIAVSAILVLWTVFVYSDVDQIIEAEKSSDKSTQVQIKTKEGELKDILEYYSEKEKVYNGVTVFQ